MKIIIYEYVKNVDTLYCLILFYMIVLNKIIGVKK